MAAYSISYGGGLRGVVAGRIILIVSLVIQNAYGANAKYSDRWVTGEAHATFYGGPNDFDYMGGACGYGKQTKEWYGDDSTTALSYAWFNNGLSCGQCFEIKCDDEVDPQWCIRGASVTVTVTNSCPPNPALPSDNGGWCNLPLLHFDMAMPAWLKVAKYKAGIVPVAYRRVPCERNNGVRFTITKSSPYFSWVLISNVGGAGAVTAVQMMGSKGNGWRDMQRNWGQNWQIDESLTGQAVSFKVETEDGESESFINALPSTANIGQDFLASPNDQFH